MKFKSFVMLLVVAALVVAVVAPAALGATSAGVKMKLTGPNSAANGAMIKITCKISNPQMADGNRVALVLQNKDGNLKRIGSKADHLVERRQDRHRVLLGQGRGLGDGHRQVPRRLDASRGDQPQQHAERRDRLTGGTRLGRPPRAHLAIAPRGRGGPGS